MRTTSSSLPYSLYTRLGSLEDLWLRRNMFAPTRLAWISLIAVALTEDLLADAVSDMRTTVLKERKVRMLERHVRCQQARVEEISAWLVAQEPIPAALLVDIEDVLAREYLGPEDKLFARVHLIVESWLAVAFELLTDAKREREQRSQQAMELVNRIVDDVSSYIEVLGEMSLADYHPLRVRLRDASGAQSERLHALPRAVEPLYRQVLEPAQMLRVLMRPEKHASENRWIQIFCEFSKRYQAFLFRHYLLVCGVLGSRSMGSLGEIVHSLVGHAATPLFPELDQALYDFVVLTNLEHGHHSGSIIMDRERQTNVELYPEPSSCDDVPVAVANAVVRDYFKHLGDRNIEAWVQLFHPEQGQIRDGKESKPFKGPRKLRVFLKAFYSTFQAATPCIRSIEHRGSDVVADWTMRATFYDGREVEYSGQEILTLEAGGRILSSLALWEPVEVYRQLRPQDLAEENAEIERSLGSAIRGDRHPSGQFRSFTSRHTDDGEGSEPFWQRLPRPHRATVDDSEGSEPAGGGPHA